MAMRFGNRVRNVGCEFLLALLLSVFSVPTIAGEVCFVMSNGSKLYFARFGQGVLSFESTLFDSSKLGYFVWPSFDGKTSRLIFEARDWRVAGAGIYQAEYRGGGNFQEPTLLISGARPSLSPDGARLAYFIEGEMLAVRDIFSETEAVVEGASGKYTIGNRVAWLNNNEIIYM